MKSNRFTVKFSYKITRVYINILPRTAGQPIDFNPFEFKPGPYFSTPLGEGITVTRSEHALTVEGWTLMKNPSLYGPRSPSMSSQATSTSVTC